MDPLIGAILGTAFLSGLYIGIAATLLWLSPAPPAPRLHACPTCDVMHRPEVPHG